MCVDCKPANGRGLGILLTLHGYGLFCSTRPISVPAGGSSEAGSRRGTLSTSSSILSVDSSPSSSFGSLEAAGAPLDSSLLCSHKYSEKELALLSQISSSTKNTVKVLCSYGGSFVDSSTAEGGKVYHGGTTRLLSIELTRETSHGKLITQLAQAWLAGNNVDSSTSHDEVLSFLHPLSRRHSTCFNLPVPFPPLSSRFAIAAPFKLHLL